MLDSSYYTFKFVFNMVCHFNNAEIETLSIFSSLMSKSLSRL